MPSVKRFALLRETARNHPIIVASTAASAGVLLGAFVVVQLLGTPQPQAESAAAPPPAVEAKAVAKPAETTGSAPAGTSVATTDCDQQAWPYLSRACMKEFRTKNRATRVISTDKLDKPTIAAIEPPAPTPPAPSAAALPAPTAPAIAASPWFTSPVAPPAPPAPKTSTATAGVAPPAANPASAAPPPGAVAAPNPAPAATTPIAPPDAQAAQPLTRAAAKAEARERAKRERLAKKARQKPKANPVPGEPDEDASASFASAAPDDDDDRAARRSDRSRRIVDRWTESEYDVPDSRGRGQRRVTVIRRSNGGLFESLFGN